MRMVTFLVATATLVSPLAIGSAHAFSTLTQDGTNANTTSAFSDPDKSLTDDSKSSSPSGFFRKEGSFSYGVTMQGGNSSSLGDGPLMGQMMGRSFMDSTTPRKPFESYIPKP